MTPTALFAYLIAYDGMVSLKVVSFILRVEVNVDVDVDVDVNVNVNY